MRISRRDFLRITGAAASGSALEGLGLRGSAAAATRMGTSAAPFAERTATICPGCSVGCGLVVHHHAGKVVSVEGDPGHPVNEGSLCSRAQALLQVSESPWRITTPLYRRRGGTEWEEVTWDWALSEIAKRLKRSRDAAFTTVNSAKAVVNRNDGIASLGSAELDNEECFLLQKWLRALGLVYIEHSGRICGSSSEAGLRESFGRGAMSNHWIDIRNSDVILISGANPAENHPIGFKWIMKAKEAGALLINLDPRLTRTSAVADLYASVRPGADIAWLGGMIKFLLDNGRYHRDYVRLYTNASFLVDKNFGLPGDMEGVFSGYDAEERVYDRSSWGFQRDGKGIIRTDSDMKDPLCVLQLLRKHFSRYSPDLVSAVCGASQETLLGIYEAFASTAGAYRAGTILYGTGWTQHTVGTQNVRAASIIQLLLGNMGVAGGGVNALAGDANARGSTDFGLLFDLLPGGLAVPDSSQPGLKTYVQSTPGTPAPLSAGRWEGRSRCIVSLLRSHFGTSAPPEEQYQWLPKTDRGQDASWLSLFDRMEKGQFAGLLDWGENPACSGANPGAIRRALASLEWMVTVGHFDNETASFWRGPGVVPRAVDTEVFFLPRAAFYEKEGSLTNSGRWVQWRRAVVERRLPSDGDIINELHWRVRKLYAEQGGVFPDPILNLSWDYGPRSPDGTVRSIDPQRVAGEINGYFLEDREVGGTSFRRGDPVPSSAYLQDDGSTSSGNWLYCQSFNGDGNKMARRRKSDPGGMGLFSDWAWSWPGNSRVLYNRASVDPYGKPWNPLRTVISWDGAGWIGDAPDGAFPPLSREDDTAHEGTRGAFLMTPEGVGRLFGPGLADGPLPEHYEPLECPDQRNLVNAVRVNPVVLITDRFVSCDDRFPVVATTFGVAEHWHAGSVSRWLPWLVELQPDNFVEMGREHASLKGIRSGDRVSVSSARASIEAFAVVTDRLRPFRVAGNTIHQVGLPVHFGWATTREFDVMANGKALSHPTRGDSSNMLTPGIGDANTMTPEMKVFMVSVDRM